MSEKTREVNNFKVHKKAKFAPTQWVDMTRYEHRLRLQVGTPWFSLTLPFDTPMGETNNSKLSLQPMGAKNLNLKPII